MLHSKVAMFNSEQAVRTRLITRISSDVSMTTIGVDELIFQAAGHQHLIDLDQLLAESSVIDVAFDGGQVFGQRQLKRDNDARHGARV